MEEPALSTPLMRQYREIKERHRDAILFFRLGDFYEMFFEDAEIASRILDIALTSRDKSAERPIPLCGVPHHSASGYISQLLDRGYKVAICEQVEDPKLAQGIVRREVVRVVSPGLRTDLEGLDAKETNPLVAFYGSPPHWGLASIEASSGEFRLADFAEAEGLFDEILRLAPHEVVFADSVDSQLLQPLCERLREIFPALRLERVDPPLPEDAARHLSSRFQVASLDGFGLENDRAASITAASALLHYAEITSRSPLPHLRPPTPCASDRVVQIDASTRRHLALYRTPGEPTDERSLFGVLDETRTSMGARQLRQWIDSPLRDLPEVTRRLDAVEVLYGVGELRESIRSELAHVYDLERLLGRISVRHANARDLVALRSTLLRVPPIRSLLADARAPLLQELCDSLDPHETLCRRLETALLDEPPVTVTEGAMIRDGFDPKLDELRGLAQGGRRWIAEFEARERARTGISSLKVRYNRVFGYFIEITNANLSKVPADYERKQTLSGAERFVTSDLKNEEARILGADEKIAALELEIFEKLRHEVEVSLRTLQNLAKQIAELDVLASLARVAVQNRFTRPKLTETERILIRGGRHPVVERFLPSGRFVPNDIELDTATRQLLVLTGPNMAGKSTIMRQVALIVLMAHVGSFVPAEAAEIGWVDRIFTRVGASDDLARGKSTFMVEMSETSNILRNATRRSLILLDEIGRGTSTFDGLAIAWAVAEDLHDRVGARTIFATHYHELTDLARTKERVRNMNVAVRQWGDQVIFLHTLAEGAVNRSYGIDVARLAGIPDPVIERARAILANLERAELDAQGKPTLAREAKPREPQDQLSLFRRPKGEHLRPQR